MGTHNLIKMLYGEIRTNIPKVTLLEPRHNKTNKVSVCPAKPKISLGIRPVWSESSLCTQWVAKDPSFLHTDSEDSDQTGRMPRLIWVFAGCTLTLLVLSWDGSLFLCCRSRSWNGSKITARHTCVATQMSVPHNRRRRTFYGNTTSSSLELRYGEIVTILLFAVNSLFYGK